MKKLEDKNKTKSNFFEEYMNDNKKADKILNMVGGKSKNNLQGMQDISLADKRKSSQNEI